MSPSRVLAALSLALLPALSSASEPPVVKGYAPVDGLKLYYEIRGSGYPLVLLHGGGSTIETSFEEFLGPLSKDHRVIAYERQGHGRTADADRPFTFKQSAEDLAALLKYLKIDKADFFGYSNGGHIAIQLALSHPELVRKLVIESAMFNRAGAPAGFWEGFKHASMKDMPKELTDAYLKVAPRPQDLHFMFEKSVKQMSGFKDWREEEISSIQAPTLILLGDKDVVTPEHALLMHKLIKHSELAILPDTEHMAIPKRAPWTIPMIEQFLAEPLPAEPTTKK